MPSLWAAMTLGVREKHFLSVGVLVEELLVRDWHCMNDSVRPAPHSLSSDRVFSELHL